MEKDYKILNFTTGPVKLSDEVRTTFGRLPVSHRLPEFMKMFHQLQKKVSKSTGAKHVSFFTGSGTLANEVMIAQIKSLGEKGIVLSNGEFGNKIINQCNRQKLDFITYKKEWGNEFDLNEIENLVKKNDDLKWLLFVHSESSTGCINNLERIIELAKKYKLKICVDVISSFCNRHLNLNDIFLASASSGKGVASFAGVAIVFSNHIPEPNNSIPTYLDLGYYFKKEGIPFTISSNLIFALNTAIDQTLNESHFEQIKILSKYLSDELKGIENLEILNLNYHLPSHIFTLKPNHQICSVDLGEALFRKNIETSFNSQYLVERNHLQIAVMGEHTFEEINYLIKNVREEIEILKKETLRSRSY
jgi:aspartate aminotransferase-like enzyme